MDRARPGSRLHVLSDRAGLTVVVGVFAGNCHDSNGLKPLVEALLAKHDPHRDRPWKPGKLHADKAYDNPSLRKRLSGRRIGVRIAPHRRRDLPAPGRHRWAGRRS